ncbi:MAG: hypothetical protein BWY74_00498 [Firmicutes bacterium ADurb.Bin419]|jgi:hypothetical protein|uniref:hypothetical protein n=1 Tax=Methanobacterium sp. MZD130B TaxID=3394378 RepID=UPI0009D5CCE8|nr:MAG: hypothetical protein BWY74_00498 [Firmicutes bacterium ADurb.Bin419]
MDEEMMYEMRIPAGITERIMIEVINEFGLELKSTDYGPVLLGKKEDLEKAQDYIVKALNQRLKELEKR